MERSPDAAGWIKLGEVAAQGTSNALTDYSFTDIAPLPGTNYYRLKMVDTDGSFTHSRIESLVFDDSGTLTVYPNPVAIDRKLYFHSDGKKQFIRVEVLTMPGKRVYEGPFRPVVELPGLQPGLYLIRVTAADASVATFKVIKH